MQLTAMPPHSPRSIDFLEAVRRHGERIAVRGRHAPLSWQALGRRAVGVATALREAGVGPGVSVAVFLRNGPAAVWASYGVMLSGACEVQLNAALSEGERAYCLALTPCAVVLCSAEDAQSFAGSGCAALLVEQIVEGDVPSFQPVDVPCDAPGRINFTSGTTGKPKAIVTSHGRRWLGAMVLTSSLPNRPTTSSSILLMTSFSHGAGLYTQAFLGCGGGIVLLDGMDMERVEGVLTEGSVDALFGSPTLLMKLAKAFEGRKIDCLRTIYCGTAALSPSAYRDIRQIFGPVVALSYGKTEIHSPIALLPPDETDRFFGEADATTSACLGWTASGVAVDVVDPAGRTCAAGEPGEIIVRAGHMSNGWIDAEGFHDWGPSDRHATGDIGFFDDRRRLRLSGRANDVIKTGGYKLFPAEVETALGALGIEATVIGVPSAYWGQIVVAASETRIEHAVLAGMLGERLAAFKQPRCFLEISSLPRNLQGKVVRGELLRMIDEKYVLVDGSHPRFEPRG